jgi:phosphatidylglycerophosphatase A
MISMVMFVIGIYICDVSEKKIGVPDYGGIVWDEIAAMVLILAFVPMSWVNWAIAFAVFRLFDAVKPWPIRWFDRYMSGGLGIMVDDLIAAFFSLAVLYGLRWLA